MYNAQLYSERLETNDAAGDGIDVVRQYINKEAAYLDYLAKNHTFNIADKSAKEIEEIRFKLDTINGVAAGSLASERKASLRLNEVDEVKNTADLVNKFGFSMTLLNVNLDHFNG